MRMILYNIFWKIISESTRRDTKKKKKTIWIVIIEN